MLHEENDMGYIYTFGKAIVYFSAPWCQPCRAIKPHYIKLAELDSRDYFIVNVDDLDNDTLIKYNIQSIPQILVLENGDKVGDIKSRVFIDMREEVASL